MEATAILRSWLGLTGLILVLVGGLVAFGTVAWSVEQRYGTWIDAPDGLSWTLWLPRSELPASASMEGGVSSVSTVVTLHGRLLNVTGVGPGRVLFQTNYLSLDLADVEIPLEGLERTGGNWTFWVWRGSVNGSAEIGLEGGTGWSASRIGDELNCGGLRFYGNVQEGWNAVPRGFSDCFHLIMSDAWVIPVMFLAPGGGLLAAAAWKVHRSSMD